MASISQLNERIKQEQRWSLDHYPTSDRATSALLAHRLARMLMQMCHALGVDVDHDGDSDD